MQIEDEQVDGELSQEAYPRIELPTDGDESKAYCLLKDGTKIFKNDCVYLLADPPSEPYNLGRVMEFTSSTHENGELLYSIRTNWFYRPRDIFKTYSDRRLVMASMHSDVHPISFVRGKCRIIHRDRIKEFEKFKNEPDSFWYERLFDRYTQKRFEVIPTEQILNLPANFLEILRNKWEFIVVEPGYGKELCKAQKKCDICKNWCSSSDSVRCSNCKLDFHLKCVYPPLPKKLTRGFGWTCEKCTAIETVDIDTIKPHTASISNNSNSTDISFHSESSFVQNGLKAFSGSFLLQTFDSRSEKASGSQDESENTKNRKGKRDSEWNLATQHQSDMWPFRYFGIHSRLEDLIDYDSRIYPKAASRIASRFQASIPDWTGKPFNGLLNLRSNHWRSRTNSHRGRFGGSARGRGKRRIKLSNMSNNISILADNSESTRGRDSEQFLNRGEENTSVALFKPFENQDELLSKYFRTLIPIAENLKVELWSANFLDSALESLFCRNFDIGIAVEKMNDFTSEDLQEVNFTEDEIKRFEEGVNKYGSELYSVAVYVGTKPVSSIVRFYYRWKKTAEGSVLWKNSPARKLKKNKIAIAAHYVSNEKHFEEIDESFYCKDDPSFYDETKFREIKKSPMCRACMTESSTRWQRIPGYIIMYKSRILVYCEKCGSEWRKYGIENGLSEDLIKRRIDSVTRQLKRKITDCINVPDSLTLMERNDSDAKTSTIPDDNILPGRAVERRVKKKQGNIIRLHQCAVCGNYSNQSDFFECVKCRISVHRACYGVTADVEKKSWLCDVCSNRKNIMFSTNYKCILCAKDYNGRIGMKRTAANNWAHIQCALMMPDVGFGSAETLDPILFLGSISPSLWGQRCTICKEDTGLAVTPNNEQKTFVHVSCALEANYSIGFRLSKAKTRPEDDKKQLFLKPFLEKDNSSSVSKLIPICDIDLSKNKPLLYGYVESLLTEEVKKIISHAGLYASSAFKKKVHEMRATAVEAAATHENDKQPIKKSIRASVKNKSEKPRSERVCERCDSFLTPRWWKIKENAYLCHLCQFGGSTKLFEVS